MSNVNTYILLLFTPPSPSLKHNVGITCVLFSFKPATNSMCVVQVCSHLHQQPPYATHQCKMLHRCKPLVHPFLCCFFSHFIFIHISWYGLIKASP